MGREHLPDVQQLQLCLARRRRQVPVDRCIAVPFDRTLSKCPALCNCKACGPAGALADDTLPEQILLLVNVTPEKTHVKQRTVRTFTFVGKAEGAARSEKTVGSRGGFIDATSYR